MSDATVHAASPAELFAHSRWLLELARRLVGEADADDVVQQTMQAAMRRQPAADQPLRPWLGRVARNFAAKYLRAATRRRGHEDGAARARAAVVPSTAELAASAETLQALVKALGTLPPPLREVVTLRFMREMTSREIGRQLHIAPGTVRWRLSQGLAELRQRLDDHCDGDRNRWTKALAAITLAGAPA
ncbi:MAG: sigma-70 family RNA polymerase sigma factor, partial [Planctomycetes bacterium]|nr:sigma-70 family RNA polymerase sigma factor [Planctomycetota bacterium]